jgi:hypothetical protein
MRDGRIQQAVYEEILLDETVDAVVVAPSG